MNFAEATVLTILKLLESLQFEKFCVSCFWS